jgi:N-acetylmuramic acid 6-phosphate etherase
MKVGTAQKLVLNMISNTIMIQLGFMKGDSKLDLQLTNRRLMERGIRMMMEAFDLDPHEALQLIEKYGSVKEAMDARRSRR